MNKKKKYIFKLCSIVLIVCMLGVLPSKASLAATYPSVFMYEDPDFNNQCVNRTMECGPDTALYFKWYRVYNNEKYKVEIFDSNKALVASAEGTPPVSSIGQITLNWDTSKRSAGRYTVEVHKMFYSYLSWHEAPNTSTYWVTLTRQCEHKWNDGVVTKEATCVEQGVKTFTCTICGETKTESLPLVDHKWDDGAITKEPTCVEQGVKTFTCTVCRTTKTEAIPIVDHKWDDGVITKEPTCVDQGVKTITCTVCGTTKTEAIPIVDHKWDDGAITKEPTCLDFGEKTFTCTVCGTKKSEEIQKLTPTITLSAKSKTIAVNKSFTLTISKLAKGDSIKGVKSSNTKIASVTRKKETQYMVKGKKKGTTKIIVTLKSGKTAICKVKVK